MDKKQEALDLGHKQLREIRKGALDMRGALVSDNDEQIKFVLMTIRLVHAYMFKEGPEIAAKRVLISKY